ncbi:MAG: ATP-dependent helicase [bacterium]|nr:ATP-dependent helicase [bacterium]
MTSFKPRPKQREVLRYTGGIMAVMAVPGSGKTRTLSALAAKLIKTGAVKENQEVLIVTLVNAAVENFGHQVRAFLTETRLLPTLGYRVRTLHGLCSDIVRERPGLVGLADDFTILDERESNAILTDAALAWLKAHPDSADEFLTPDLEAERRERVLRDDWGDLVASMAAAFVRQAKDEQLTPDMLRARLDDRGGRLTLADLCSDIYASYERSLHMRGAVDFQDLIRLALTALQQDSTYLRRLRERHPFVLEDEAQDSSLLQEQILRLLAGEHGNWVRVGDPNQAIYETFTTARPEHLRQFAVSKGVQQRALPNSGRSAPKIIDLANHLIGWTRGAHPNPAIRQRDPLTPPLIEPTPPDDPQPNPPDDEANIWFFENPMTPAEEIQTVVASLARWLPEHPDQTAAVLVPRNKRGFDMVDALNAARLPMVELLRSTTNTREAAGALGNILQYLTKPGDANLLARIYRVWRRDDRDDEAASAKIDAVAAAIRKCAHVEDFIWNTIGRDWLDESPEVAALDTTDPFAKGLLESFRVMIRRWQEAVLLPIDQLILVLAGDLFQVEADLAIAHSIAVLLRQRADAHPDWRLPEYTDELAAIARNERRFLGVSDADRGFNPDQHKGRVTVATMHAAKGLEWDRVYLLSVNNYDFPSAEPGDQYISERWFIRDRLNLEAETLGQLAALKDGSAYREGAATETARIDYAAERLRLLYVGITRARRELIVTYNTGRNGKVPPAVAFAALRSYVEAGENGTGV